MTKKTTKPKKSTSPRLHIANEMRCMDLKDRGFYDSLDDEEKKKFSPFLMIRWGSSVEERSDMEQFYVMAVNEHLNKHFFAINRHPKLQWLCATAVSPACGPQKHVWIPPGGKKHSRNEHVKKLAQLFPHYKQQDLELLIQLNTDDDIRQYLQDRDDVL